MLLRRGWLGVLTQVMYKTGSHTPLGNFSSKRGNKNFYKGRGGNKYGIPGPKGGFILRTYPKWNAPDTSDFPVRSAASPSCAQCIRADEFAVRAHPPVHACLYACVVLYVDASVPLDNVRLCSRVPHMSLAAQSLRGSRRRTATGEHHVYAQNKSARSLRPPVLRLRY